MTKAKKSSVTVKDMKSKASPKGGGTTKPQQQQYLEIKMNDVVVTSASTATSPASTSLPAVQSAALKIK